MSKHTPEPWVMSTKASGNWWHISAGNQAIAAVHAASKKRNEPYASMFEANARRIIACVNACAGVDTDLLETGELDKPTMLVIQENKDLKHCCDELLAALEGVLAVVGDSTGVAGYHLNGDIADWDEFDEINAVYTAIAKAKGNTAAEVDSCCP